MFAIIRLSVCIISFVKRFYIESTVELLNVLLKHDVNVNDNNIVDSYLLYMSEIMISRAITRFRISRGAKWVD